MQVKLIKEDEQLLIALTGEIDISTSEDFYNQVRAIYTHAKKDIIFDCKPLTFIDSTALGTFVKIFKEMKNDGHKFVLCGVSARIHRVFQICSLDRIMEISQ